MTQPSEAQEYKDQKPLILPEVDPSATPLDLAVSRFTDIDAKDLLSQAKLARYYQNTNARHDLKEWAKRVVTWWLVFVAVVLMISGFNWLKLSETVLVTLLATTTLNILGLAYIVLKGHFPEDDHEI